MSMGPENDDIRISKAEMQDKCGWGEECHIRLLNLASRPSFPPSASRLLVMCAARPRRLNTHLLLSLLDLSPRTAGRTGRCSHAYTHHPT